MNRLEYTFSEGDEKAITFIAVGDVMFSRNVGEKALQNGIQYFFSSCEEIFKSADIRFCNFESPITDSDLPSKYSRSNFKTSSIYKKDISEYFDVVSLANNHIYDYGAKGAEDTVKNLQIEKIKTIGAGKSLENAHSPAIITIENVSVGFLAYTCLPTVEEYLNDYAVSTFEEKTIEKDIKDLKERVDVCIVSLHGGHELISYVEPSFIHKAKYAVDCGADLVLGHHPHVISGVEIYEGKPIIYSLGNFIFDNPTIPERKESFILQASLDKTNGISSIRLLPVFINAEFIPTIAEGDILSKIEKKINNLSEYLTDERNDAMYWKTASKGFINNGKENIIVSFSNLGIKGIFVMAKRLQLRHFKLLAIALKNKIVGSKNMKRE